MKNFTILSSNRVGSTVLREALNSHSKLKVLDEFFCWNCEYWTRFRNEFLLDIGENPADFNKRSDCRNVLKHLFERYNGLKLHRWQFSDDNPSWNYIFNNSKIVFLYRKNKIQQFISLKRSQKDKIWHVRNNESIPKRKKIKLNLQELNNFINFETYQENQKTNALREFDYIKVCYEDLNNNIESVFSNILSFIDIDYEPLEVNLKKMNKQSIQQNVFNYEELIEQFKNTHYEFMLNE